MRYVRIAMRCPADRAACTQVKDQRTSELAPSVKP
jgi:hypothetical protein